MEFGGSIFQPKRQRPRVRIPRPRSAVTLHKTGPLWLPQDEDHRTSIWPAPDNFPTAHTSFDEWPIYAAINDILSKGRDPRQPPFTGEPGKWEYQSDFAGGRATRGGAVIDFLIQLPGEEIAVRIQTEFRHVFGDANKQMTDWLQRLSMGNAKRRVHDIFSQNYIGDRSGQAARAAVMRALRGEPEPNPIYAGTAQRVRSPWSD